jgi:YVTN family beta-propeller protein
VATVPVGNFPNGIAVTPDGSKAYVANRNSDNVSVINTATNTVVATVPVGNFPNGIAVTPDGSKVYVANRNSDNVSVINTATNTVVATVMVGDEPYGLAIGTPPATSIPESTYEGNLVFYPSPTSDKINLEWNNPKQEDALLEIIDNSGRKVMEMNFQAVVGKNEKEINVKKLPEGSYHIRLQMQGKNYSSTIIISR